MLHEHDLGRKFIKNLDEGVEENNKKKIIENTREYVRLLQEHISKEDDILFPMADEALGSETKEKMISYFEKVEQEQTNEKNRSLEFVEELA